MKTILITGGNGFLGSNIVKSLLGNYNLIVLEKNTKNLLRLDEIINKIKVYDIDVTLPDIIFQENKIDLILHCATVYGRNNEKLEAVIETNLILPLTLVRLGVKYHVNVFVNTDTVLDKKTSVYALSKAHLRDWLQMYSNELKVVNIQLEHFYGPGGSMDNFILLMIKKMLDNTTQIDLTLGEQKRDFLYFDDVVSAFTTVINNLDRLSECYSTIQVASGEVVSIRFMVETIKALTNSSSILNFGAIPYRTNELMEPITSNETICSLGWKPSVTLKDGLRQTINYYKKTIN